MKPPWFWRPLSELFDIARGGSPRPIDNFISGDASGVNWIMIGDAVEGSKYIRSTKKRIRPEGVERSRMVKPGDLLLTNSMSFGRPYIMKTSGCIHDGWLVLSPKNTDLHPDFFYHLLGSDTLYREFTKLAAGATVKNLNIGLVSGVTVPFPPFDEQKRIAALLDKADALRRKRQEALRLTDDFLRATFLDLFGDPVTNPKGWETVPLSSLVPHDDVINYGVVQPGEDVEEGVPLVRAGDVESGVQDSRVLKHIAHEIDAQYRRSKLRGGELLIGCVGAIGSTMIAGKNLAGANIARAVARVRLKPHIEAEYVLGLLKTPGVQAYFQNEVRQVAQPTLNIKQIRETPVLLPPQSERLRFQAIYRKLTQSQQAARTSSEVISTLFSALQQRAFSGQL